MADITVYQYRIVELQTPDGDYIGEKRQVQSGIQGLVLGLIGAVVWSGVWVDEVLPRVVEVVS